MEWTRMKVFWRTNFQRKLDVFQFLILKDTLQASDDFKNKQQKCMK